MAKITKKKSLKVQQFTKKLPQNQKNIYIKLKNDENYQKITYRIYINLHFSNQQLISKIYIAI
jgi:hypothetical protein